MILLAHDGANDAWYNSLKREDGKNTYNCCDLKDCRPSRADIRTTPEGTQWWVFIPVELSPTAGWQRVPPDRVLQHHDNPVGEAVVCWYNDQIWCFVPPVQG